MWYPLSPPSLVFRVEQVVAVARAIVFHPCGSVILSHALKKFLFDMGRSQTLKRVLGCFYFVSRFRSLEMCSYRNRFYFPVRVMLAGSGYIKIAPDNKYLRKYNGKVVCPSGLVRTGHKGPREVKCGYNIVKLRENSVFKFLTLSQVWFLASVQVHSVKSWL